ncbi:hypothetical protein [Siphonobacter sp. SORGH_AS_1065]|uniref:hypothetical protein n=1 Tax=Siphonobacter sp. SORGH_AS_1065 TaxID=3041795 RepID=UPI0027814DD7|nr:hypothetical protein [Siphonobacter sp. SORGH_AS_1065]MDQ1086339.1 hypothetical protein [Siphonobacter sp. SORGH_AS_1065]
MRKFKFTSFFILFLFLFFSCSKQLEIKPNLPARKPDYLARGGRQNTSYIAWENADFFYYKDDIGTTRAVRTPWSSGGSSVFSFYEATDRLQQDGWVLLYSTLDPNQFIDNKLFFILYNKWRGIVRVFFYNKDNPPSYSNYVLGKLRFGSDGVLNSGLLNFSEQFASAKDIKSDRPFTIISNINPSSINTGALNNSWYSFDYEIAYDPTITSVNEMSVGMDLEARAIGQQKISLTGSLDGSIDGTIEISGKEGSSLINTLFTSNDNSISNVIGNVRTGSRKSSAKDGILKILGSAITDGFKSSVENAANTLATGGLNIITSPISKFFNSLIASPAENTENVHLKMNAKLKVQGTAESEFLLYNQHFFVPGTIRNSNNPGLVPYYDKPLGVFNISTTPVINVSAYGSDGITYSFNPSTFNVDINPEVANDITISEIQKSIVWLKTFNGISVSPTSTSPVTLITRTEGKQENTNTPFVQDEWYDSGSNTFRIIGRNGRRMAANVKVRVSFKIQPNNGGKSVYISKIFNANVVGLENLL